MNKPSRWCHALVVLMLGVLATGCRRESGDPAPPRDPSGGNVDKATRKGEPGSRFEATSGMDPKDIALWEKAGAKFGWLSHDSFGSREFVTKRPPNAVRVGTGPIIDSPPVPCFQCKQGLPTGIHSLPKPTVPFGLDLAHSAFGDADMQALGRFDQLQALMACGTKIGNSGLAVLTKLPRLQILAVCSTNVTEKGLDRIAALPALTVLDIGGLDITDAGLRVVAGIENLHSLRLFRTKITNEGLKELAKLPHLDTLDLQETKLTDAGMKELARCMRLRYVILLFTEVTKEGAKMLQKSLPECQVSLL